MNKVVTVEIASQMFWIDAQAHGVLQTYLQKIRMQLVDDECANEIYQDIELRVAELLFALNSDEHKAIVIGQLEPIIAQVGYIDDETIDAVRNEHMPKVQDAKPEVNANTKLERLHHTGKNMLAALVLFIAFFASAGILVFSQSALFSSTITWLLSGAALYLMVLGLLVYLETFYWTEPKFKINKLLKVSGFVPGALIVFALVFVDNTQSISQSEQVTITFELNASKVNPSPKWFA